MPNKDEIEALAPRMGEHEYRARIALEQSRRAGHGDCRGNRLAALIGRYSSGLRWAFRLTGLHSHAYRQFHRLPVHNHTLSLRRLPNKLDGFRILHLSDLHLDLDPTLLDSLIRALEGLVYDLCVITGDFRNQTVGPFDETLVQIRRLLRHLKAPVYAVLGNHDVLAMVPPLERDGMRFLLNEQVCISNEKASFHLLGIDDPNIYATHNLERAMRGLSSEATSILLSHSPAIHAEAASKGIDCVLAGHTHGGQICLPGGGVLLRNDPSPKQLLRGAWHFDGMPGYTSPGTGACGVPLRLFCPAEITLHRLTAPQRSS